MSTRSTSQQVRDWLDAVEAVKVIADTTDSHSASKTFLSWMARFVQDEPELVADMLATL